MIRTRVQRVLTVEKREPRFKYDALRERSFRSTTKRRLASAARKRLRFTRVSFSVFDFLRVER